MYISVCKICIYFILLHSGIISNYLTSCILFQLQLSDLEEKFRKAMISNAQLDNEKSAYIYQVETLKDEIEEMQENLTQIHKEYREKKRVCSISSCSVFITLLLSFEKFSV